MKKLMVILMMLAFVSLAWAEGHECPQKDEETSQAVAQCPKTQMTDKCLYCHTAPTFALKEADPHVIYDYPFVGAIQNFRFEFNELGKPVAAYFIMSDIDANTLQTVMKYCTRHGVNHLIVELFTPGGSLIDAYKSVGLIRHWQSQGNVIETRCYGLAASAGFLIFASGTHGTRFISPQAELMWHELQTLTIFNVESPSDKEDEAKVLRHLQDTANSWLAEVSGKTKQEIDELVRKKEYWINGKEAVEMGFADGLLGAK